VKQVIRICLVEAVPMLALVLAVLILLGSVITDLCRCFSVVR
jgi:F0F1-type ATP synthase membrane subunit c/vacuolar-type H+-ATPase subunit K